MPDVTVLPTGGTQSRGGTNWLLIGGLGVGAIFLLLMLTRKSSGQPTTAAGTSINAALGSIQEQNLNVMGEVSKSASSLSNELGAINNNVVVGGQASAWQTNMVAWAAGENAAVLANPNMDAATKQTTLNDIQNRLTQAYQNWLAFGGPPSETPGTGNMPVGTNIFTLPGLEI